MITAALTLFMLFSGGVAQAASPDEELARLKKAMEQSSERQENLSARLDLLSSEIRSIKEKAVSVATKLTRLDRDLIDTEQRLADIRDIENQTLAALNQQHDNLGETLSALLQLSRQPEGTLIGNPEGLINSLRTSVLLKSAVPELKREADQLSQQLETLASLRDQHLEEKKNFLHLKESRQSEQETLNALFKSKDEAQSSLRQQSTREARKQEQLRQEARDFEALILRLEEEKKQRLAAERQRIAKEIARQEKLQQEAAARQRAEAEAEAKRRADAAKNRQTGGQSVASIPTPVPSRKAEAPRQETPAGKRVSPAEASKSLAALGSGRPFSKVKGSLPLPVGGRIVSSFGNKRSANKKNGIVIETRNDAVVVSPYDGQIAFAGPFRHYGLLLIIDHGEGYHTLLAGLGSIEGAVGQLVLAGEPVGQMNSGNDENPTLYMELRDKGTPVNPVPWLMAGSRKVSG
ncbi:murein hydrolase activator EnvC family protein [Sneathiella chinensis]|uniref:Peptidase M23 n=1 Tax=Sneathiella chinensis TaxID=349750 RepID=A0ABQ5U6U8_9PROT|nr:peptidoglycan DD-metalloendopeptidase family protein [Sneathiella chinensis]GLQ07875.1 peptidase M23 [Sneathiella chinensis]